MSRKQFVREISGGLSCCHGGLKATDLLTVQPMNIVHSDNSFYRLVFIFGWWLVSSLTRKIMFTSPHSKPVIVLRHCLICAGPYVPFYYVKDRRQDDLSKEYYYEVVYLKQTCYIVLYGFLLYGEQWVQQSELYSSIRFY